MEGILCRLLDAVPLFLAIENPQNFIKHFHVDFRVLSPESIPWRMDGWELSEHILEMEVM